MSLPLAAAPERRAARRAFLEARQALVRAVLALPIEHLPVVLAAPRADYDAATRALAALVLRPEAECEARASAGLDAGLDARRGEIVTPETADVSGQGLDGVEDHEDLVDHTRQSDAEHADQRPTVLGPLTHVDDE